MRRHGGPLRFRRHGSTTLFGAFLSTGCSGPLSALDPAGRSAEAISDLWWVMLAGGSAIFLLVMALLARAFLTPGPGEASVRKWIIGAGLVFPSVVLILLLAFGIAIGERLLPRADPRLIEVAAEGSQWQWRFTQPGRDGRTIRTDGTLHIPVGRPVDVMLTTRDVIHAFWVPRLAGKMDAIPGHRNVLRIEAAAPGVYQGVCAEYCGIGHARHAFSVIALDPADWARFQSGGDL